MAVFLIIAAIVLFLLLLPISVNVVYKNEVRVYLKVLFIKIKLYPKNKKSDKSGKKFKKSGNNKKERKAQSAA